MSRKLIGAGTLVILVLALASPLVQAAKYSSPTSNGPGPGPAPTATILPGPGPVKHSLLSVKVTFEGRTDPSKGSRALEIRYHLSPISFDGADIRDGVLTADTNGSFILDVTKMQKGTYVLWVKSPLYLALLTPVELNGDESIQVNPSLLVGDANDDNVVNTKDMEIVKDSFGTDNPNADFNGDKVVNALDSDLLRRNFNKEGDPKPE
jgi:hypothetical protein